MRRITNFGSFTIDQRLDVLENKLEKGDILLFQYYESNSEYLKEQDRINEYYNVLKSFSLFSCIVLKEGEGVDKFSVGYVVEETADNYDLLIFKNG